VYFYRTVELNFLFLIFTVHSVQKPQVWLKSDKNIWSFTWRPQ